MLDIANPLYAYPLRFIAALERVLLSKAKCECSEFMQAYALSDERFVATLDQLDLLLDRRNEDGTIARPLSDEDYRVAQELVVEWLRSQGWV